MANITLYDYLSLMDGDVELTVYDKDYDMETYFYNYLDSGDSIDNWDSTMMELSKLLTVTHIYDNSVDVNLMDVIENKLDKLKKANLFIDCDIENIMDDMEKILSGQVSESWLERFVDVLSKE